MTRAAAQAEVFLAALRAEGAVPVAMPVVEITPPPDPAALARAAAAVTEGAYGAVLFTSQNTVSAVVGALAAQGLAPASLARARVLAVGPATARSLRDAGVEVHDVARTFLGDALAPVVLAQLGDARPRILLPRAETAREALPNALRALGFPVDVVTAYVTRGAHPAAMVSLAEELARGQVDAITLTSGSTATSLLEAMVAAVGEARARAALASTALVSIGPRTTETATALGLRVDATASVYTTDGLLGALREHFARDDPPPAN